MLVHVELADAQKQILNQCNALWMEFPRRCSGSSFNFSFRNIIAGYWLSGFGVLRSRKGMGFDPDWELSLKVSVFFPCGFPGGVPVSSHIKRYMRGKG